MQGERVNKVPPKVIVQRPISEGVKNNCFYKIYTFLGGCTKLFPELLLWAEREQKVDPS